jgi:nitrogen fixation/metabolism regulation signal transduction histidine kinase
MLANIIEIVKVIVKWLFSKSGYREWMGKRKKDSILKNVRELEDEYVKAVSENRMGDADRILADLKRMREQLS